MSSKVRAALDDFGQLECRQSLTQIVKAYREKLLANLEQSSFSRSHADAVAHCTHIFENLGCVKSLPEAEKLKLMRVLSLDVTTTCNEIAQEHAQEQAQKLLQEFKETLATTEAVSGDALKSELSRVQNMFEATWLDICSVAALHEADKTEFNSNIEAELKNHVTHLAIKAALRKQKEEPKNKNDVKVSVESLEKLSKLLRAAGKTPIDLEEKAGEAMTWEAQVVSQLQNKLNACSLAEIKILNSNLNQMAAAMKLAGENRKAEAEKVRLTELRKEDRARDERELRDGADTQNAEYEQLRRKEQCKLEAIQIQDQITRQHNEQMQKDIEAREARKNKVAREQGDAQRAQLEVFRRGEQAQAQAAAKLLRIEQRNEMMKKEHAKQKNKRGVQSARVRQRQWTVSMDTDCDCDDCCDGCCDDCFDGCCDIS